ncbi:hypothetical protein TPHV1_10282 [Treponema phagedenis]|uniref:Uncharacterized protein n=1 Tax=Treponema phagedenis TaxID=162 RepID=A0A0B7GPW6_TREPH|nr:hypothetical protein TPHV1_10282 [Treponema phagedenis]
MRIRHSYGNRHVRPWFQADRFSFCHGGQNQNGHECPWFQADGLVFDMDLKNQNGHGHYNRIQHYYGKLLTVVPCRTLYINFFLRFEFK